MEALPKPVPIADWITVRFAENLVETVVLVGVDIERQEGDPAHAGTLILAVEEWDRIWRSLVDAAGPFERRGISLVRTHAPERI